jgi:hypothetical protein
MPLVIAALTAPILGGSHHFLVFNAIWEIEISISGCFIMM